MKNFKQGGLTLIELIVVIAIVGILATVAMVSIGGRKAEDQTKRESQQFKAMVLEARNAAINSGVRVQFVFSPTTFRWCVSTCYGTTGLPRSQTHDIVDVKVKKYAREPVITSAPPSVLYSLPNLNRHFYIEPDGMIIGYTTDSIPRGITLYFENIADTTVRYKVAILPLMGKGKVMAKW